MESPPTNPFATLGLPERFDLSRTAIERASLTRLAGVHPDRSQDDARRAAEINDARRRLLDPEQRANAVLAAIGGPSAAESKQLPDGFLASIMTARMQLEEDADSGDPARIGRWHRWAEEERQAYINRAAAAFEQGEDPGEIRAMLNAWRYIERLREQLPDEPADR
ncbi:MAG: iron-sulfur cluster co-chaperone HscB C-terminal domain-containing protein [Planctomycetota bacterium]